MERDPITVRRTTPKSLVLFVVLVMTSFSMAPAVAQKKKSPPKSATPAKPVDELTRLRAEFVKATQDYKANLTQLIASYEKSVVKAQQKLDQSRVLYTQGLISKNDLEAAERALAEANDKVTETRQRVTNADAQIADTLVEAEAEKSLAKTKSLPKGSMLRTTAYIRYNGGASWALTDAWKVQRFFQDTFKHPLPIAVFGQGSIHDRWRLDHHN
ncbi:MAG TPA: TolC family protein, partial [Pyrinomonadaceae bacterium]|nr:TolC family protein [Pyrinomonadaceae bacterium]